MIPNCPTCGRRQRSATSPVAQVVAGTVEATDAPVLSRAWTVALALLTDQWQRRVDLVPLVAALTPCAPATVENLLIEAARSGVIESVHDTSPKRRVLLRRIPTDDQNGARP